jgi:aminoacrylate peracid reductase
MPKRIIVPKGAPPPLAPYSPGTRAGNIVYVSGCLALGPDGKALGIGDVRAQTRHAIWSRAWSKKPAARWATSPIT